jgi:hypothetical protein
MKDLFLPTLDNCTKIWYFSKTASRRGKCDWVFGLKNNCIATARHPPHGPGASRPFRPRQGGDGPGIAVEAPRGGEPGGGVIWNLLPRIANCRSHGQANDAMSYTGTLEAALRSAHSHVYRHLKHGKHDQDRIDAQQWIESYGPLVRTIVQRPPEPPSERRLVDDARRAIRGL